MTSSNWLAQKEKSNYHFDWNRQEPAGFDYTWIGRFEGNWEEELQTVIKSSEAKTWQSRSKNYHKYDPKADAEEYDLIQAGMNKDQHIYHKYFEFKGTFKKMVDALGLENPKGAFHIQFPGEMLNLHVDKQYEYNEDPADTARFFIFLEDWKPGNFFQMGTSFIQWRKGDIVWFDWKNIPHATANAGWEPRSLITYTGTITDKTRQLMMPNHETIKV